MVQLWISGTHKHIKTQPKSPFCSLSKSRSGYHVFSPWRWGLALASLLVCHSFQGCIAQRSFWLGVAGLIESCVNISKEEHLWCRAWCFLHLLFTLMWFLLFFLIGDVYIQPTQDTKNPVIYGVFSVSGLVHCNRRCICTTVIIGLR